MKEGPGILLIFLHVKPMTPIKRYHQFILSPFNKWKCSCHWIYERQCPDLVRRKYVGTQLENKMGFADYKSQTVAEIKGLPDYLIQTGQQVSKLVTTTNGQIFFIPDHQQVLLKLEFILLLMASTGPHLIMALQDKMMVPPRDLLPLTAIRFYGDPRW